MLERKLYARRALPKDLGQQVLPPKYPTQYDVELLDCFGNIVSRYPWHYSNKPDKRYKYVMHNCSRYLVTFSIG